TLVADAAAAGHDLGAIRAALRYIAGDPFELLLRNQWAHLSLGIEARPDLELARLLRDALDQALEHTRMRIEPRARRADLTGIVEDRPRGARHRNAEISVGKYDDG